MPTVFALEFDGVPLGRVRPTGMHAFLSAWFDENRPIHTDAKGYSLGPITSMPFGVGVEVACASDELAQSLAALPPGHRVRFGDEERGVWARVRSYPAAVRGATWRELTEPTGANQWRLELLTETALRRDGVDQPWPAPAPLLAGLARKWLQCSGEPPACTPEDLLPVLVTGVELTSQLNRDGRTPVWGAVGMLEWTWNSRDRSAHPEGAAVVDSLLRLAEFTGLGSYPQFGLGQVRVRAARIAPGLQRTGRWPSRTRSPGRLRVGRLRG